MKKVKEKPKFLDLDQMIRMHMFLSNYKNNPNIVIEWKNDNKVDYKNFKAIVYNKLDETKKLYLFFKYQKLIYDKKEEMYVQLYNEKNFLLTSEKCYSYNMLRAAALRTINSIIIEEDGSLKYNFLPNKKP